MRASRPQVSTTGTSPSIALERLRDRPPLLRIQGRNVTKADVLVVADESGRRLVLKDYASRPWWLRQSLGRWMIARETAAYRAAQGLTGVPRFRGRCGAFALALEWIDAKPLADLPADGVHPAVAPQLQQRVQALHDRGVALGDLHRRDVLVGDRGEVWLVDLATAIVLGADPGPWRLALFRRACDADRVAVARIVARLRGEDPDAAVAQVGAEAARWHRRGRRFRGWVDRLRRQP